VAKAITRRAKPAQREIEIGARLKEAREFLGFSQLEFAEGIGIKRVRLASYETGRHPIRWEIALKICRRFQISEDWLATGGVKKKGWPREAYRFGPGCRAAMFKASDAVLETLRPGGLFSEVFDSILSNEYWKLLGQSASTWTRFDFSEIETVNQLTAKMEADLGKWSYLLTDSDRKRFCEGVISAGAILFHALFSDQYRDPSGDPKRNSVASTDFEKYIERELIRLGLLSKRN
jgi:transcriptional regulator with XRE-family HTH domain